MYDIIHATIRNSEKNMSEEEMFLQTYLLTLINFRLNQLDLSVITYPPDLFITCLIISLIKVEFCYVISYYRVK